MHRAVFHKFGRKSQVLLCRSEGYRDKKLLGTWVLEGRRPSHGKGYRLGPAWRSPRQSWPQASPDRMFRARYTRSSRLAGNLRKGKARMLSHPGYKGRIRIIGERQLLYLASLAISSAKFSCFFSMPSPFSKRTASLKVMVPPRALAAEARYCSTLMLLSFTNSCWSRQFSA